MVIKRVIGLEGFANSGKTSILKKVAKKLIDDNPTGKVKSVFRGSDVRRKGSCDLVTKNVGDVTIVLEINGCIIVIVSGGDEENVVERVKNLLKKVGVCNVDVLIVAMRYPSVSQAYKVTFGKSLVRLFKLPIRRWETVPLKAQEDFTKRYVDMILGMIWQGEMR